MSQSKKKNNLIRQKSLCDLACWCEMGNKHLENYNISAAVNWRNTRFLSTHNDFGND